MNIEFESGEVLTAEKMNKLIEEVESKAGEIEAKLDEELGGVAETLERLNDGDGV